jgi:hypothetical protein
MTTTTSSINAHQWHVCEIFRKAPGLGYDALLARGHDSQRPHETEGEFIRRVALGISWHRDDIDKMVLHAELTVVDHGIVTRRLVFA